MSKTKEKNKQQLKENYEKACNAYVVELLRMWDLDDTGYYGYWIGDDIGGVYAYGDNIFLNMSDIIFCVENDVEEKEYEDWQDYTIFANEFKQSVPNFPSWHKGCPRLSKEQQDKLIALKKNLNDCINEFKDSIKS